MARNPPGPSGVPVFGSSQRYARNPFRFVRALERAYGDVSRFDVGPESIYVVCDPDAIERVLVGTGDRFRKPEPRDGALDDLLGQGLLLSEGEVWEHQRDLANRSFSMGRLSELAGRITGHADDHVADWADGDVVDVEREMTRITLDVILDLMLGVELPAERIRDVEQQLRPLGERFEPNPLRLATPAWMPMPGDRAVDEAIEGLRSVVDDIVEQREASGTAEDRADLLSTLLRARERGEQPTERLRDEVMTTLLAGHDTTALALTYTWFLLSENPAAADRVQGEVDDVLDGDDAGFEHVRELEYTEWVIQEAMRLYPPVFQLFRETTAEVELSGYPVPAGSIVMLPQWAVHRSERFYDEPERFDPERWAPDRAPGRPRFAYFPFGAGPRICIGKHLAMLEAQLVVARIASEYELDYLGSKPLALTPSLTAHPRQVMRMRVAERAETP